MDVDQAATCVPKAHGWFTFFGELWFQNLILVSSAIIAIWTLRSAALIDRRRATVESVRDHMQDSEVIKARQILRPLRDAPIDFENFLRIGNEGLPARQAALTILNSYEFMAAGIRDGAFDEKTYQRMYFVNAQKDWQFFAPFVQGLQKQYGRTLYQEFQRLVIRWRERPLRED